MKMLRLIDGFSPRVMHLLDNETSISHSTIQLVCDEIYTHQRHEKMYQAAGSGVWRIDNKGIWVASLDRNQLTMSDLLFGINMIAEASQDSLGLMIMHEDIRKCVARGLFREM